MTRHRFAGTSHLVRLILRLERIKLSLWLIGLLTLVAITPWSVRSLIESEAEAQGVSSEQVLIDQAELVGTNGATIALQGPPDALDTFGGRYIFEIGAFTLAIVALMNILLIARHTRAEEESGRAELVRAAEVGRWSALAAVSLLAVAANAVLAIGTSTVFISDGQQATSSMLYGASFGLCGLLFAAFALVWVQVFEYGRAATGMSLAGLAVAFALRAIGDVRDSWLSLLSPMGWVQAINPFGDTILWPLAVAGLAVAGAGGGAIALSERRDVGAGLVQQRPGPPTASSSLGTPLGLAWRLQRPTLAWWTVGAAFLGAIYGSVISAIDELVEDNEVMLDMLEAMGMAGDELRQGFITVILSMAALIALAGVIQSILRPRTEELAGRAEPVLATAISRRAWLSSHLLLAALAAPVFMIAAGIGLVVADALVVGAFTDVGATFGAALVRVPAMWAVAGIGMLLYGWSRRSTLGVWAVFSVVAIIFLFGELIRLPDMALNLSPLRHVTHWPGGDQGWVAVATLLAIAVGAGVAGLVGFERRDVQST